jgi:hypothetical protein
MTNSPRKLPAERPGAAALAVAHALALLHARQDHAAELAHCRAMADCGAICSRSPRSAQRDYGGVLAQMQCASRERHGLPVVYMMMGPYGRPREGVRRSAF